MLIVEAEQYCEENNVLLKGKLGFDPYIGWLDEYKGHLNGWCQLCDLNIADKLCSGDCGDGESCKM